MNEIVFGKLNYMSDCMYNIIDRTNWFRVYPFAIRIKWKLTPIRNEAFRRKADVLISLLASWVMKRTEWNEVIRQVRQFTFVVGSGAENSPKKVVFCGKEQSYLNRCEYVVAYKLNWSTKLNETLSAVSMARETERESLGESSTNTDTPTENPRRSIDNFQSIRPVLTPHAYRTPQGFRFESAKSRHMLACAIRRFVYFPNFLFGCRYIPCVKNRRLITRINKKVSNQQIFIPSRNAYNHNSRPVRE